MGSKIYIDYCNIRKKVRFLLLKFLSYFFLAFCHFFNLFNNIKAINWKGILNGTSKTINTINQAIPLIRNTRPMINNIKNMVSIAKAFGKETAIDSVVSSKNLIHNSDTQILNDNIKVINEKNYPTFFI